MSRIVVIAALLLTAGLMQSAVGNDRWEKACEDLGWRLSGWKPCQYERLAPVYNDWWNFKGGLRGLENFKPRQRLIQGASPLGPSTDTFSQ